MEICTYDHLAERTREGGEVVVRHAEFTHEWKQVNKVVRECVELVAVHAELPDVGNLLKCLEGERKGNIYIIR